MGFCVGRSDLLLRGAAHIHLGFGLGANVGDVLLPANSVRGLAHAIKRLSSRRVRDANGGEGGGVRVRSLLFSRADLLTQIRCDSNIDNYEFPMVTLAEETRATAVCTIFETLNRTGRQAVGLRPPCSAVLARGTSAS